MGYWQDKVVVITGGSAGFGRSLAASYAASGANVVIAARGQQRLDATAEALPGRVSPVVTDVTDDASVNQLVKTVVDEHGTIDAWVNAAGRSSRGWATSTSPAEFAELLELNFLALVRCCRAALPVLKKSAGHLVNIGSLASRIAGPYLAAYPASKFPVAAYSQQLRMELESEGVHVLLVCPGPIAREGTNTRYDRQARNLPRKARLPGAGARIKQLCPNKLARRVLLVCQQRRPELVVPWNARVLCAIAMLFPRLGDRILNYVTRHNEQPYEQPVTNIE